MSKEIKENTIDELDKIKIPNLPIKTNDEKGIINNFKNTLYNIKISNILKTKNKIKTNINKEEKINKKYEEKILKIRKKFIKNAKENNINLQELKKQYTFLIENNNKKEAVKILKDPLLFLMRNNLKLEIYQNAETGWFLIPNTRKKRRIWLDTNNCYDADLFGDTYKVLIHHVNETFDYPVKPIHDSEKVTSIIELTWAQAKEENKLDENKKKLEITDILIYAVIGIAVIVGIIYGLPYLFNALGLSKEPAVQIVKNTSGAVDMNTLPVIGGVIINKLFKKK
ncbi:MAG: hypothetical protein PHN22_04730 [Candidatus ainarchaeum sp.]|nr:hypothetical protein [Candidatus ainarchaeum sp.]